MIKIHFHVRQYKIRARVCQWKGRVGDSSWALVRSGKFFWQKVLFDKSRRFWDFFLHLKSYD